MDKSDKSDKSNLPYTVIIEQPAEKTKFRYLNDSRTPSLHGISSTKDKITFPTVKVMNYTGPVFIIASCVFHEIPYMAHPHQIGGTHGCKYGISTVPFDAGPNNEYVYTNFYIDYVKQCDVYNSLLEREKYLVDPYKNGFKHKSNAKTMNLSAVRICYQVFLKQDKLIPIFPAVTNIIYDTRVNNELLIYDLSDCVSPVSGNKKIMLFCEKVNKDNIAIRFYQLSDKNHDKEVWFGYGKFNQCNVHRKTAIAFKTPKYTNKQESNDVINAFIQLERISDKARGPPHSFQFIPDLDILSNIKKRKIHQKTDLLNNLKIPKENVTQSVTTASTSQPPKKDTLNEHKLQIQKPTYIIPSVGIPSPAYNCGITNKRIITTNVPQPTENNQTNTYSSNDRYMPTVLSNINPQPNQNYLPNIEPTSRQHLLNWNTLNENPRNSFNLNYPQVASNSSNSTTKTTHFNQNQLQLQSQQQIHQSLVATRPFEDPMSQTTYHQHESSLNQAMNQATQQCYPQIQLQQPIQSQQVSNYFQQSQMHQTPNQITHDTQLQQPVYESESLCQSRLQQNQTQPEQRIQQSIISDNKSFDIRFSNQQSNFQQFDQKCLNISNQYDSENNLNNNKHFTNLEQTYDSNTATVDVPTVVLDHELNLNNINQSKLNDNNLSHNSSERNSITPSEVDQYLLDLINEDGSLLALSDSFNSFSFSQ